MRERLARLTERWPWLRTAVAVQERVVDLNGGYAASAVTLMAFLSLFPLLLVAIAVVGLMSGSNPQFTNDLVRELGLTGQAAETLRNSVTAARDSAKASTLIGFLGLVWSGLGLAGAMRYAVNLPWDIAVRGWKAKLLGIPWLVGAGIVVAASIGASTVVNWLPGWTWPLAFLVGLAVDVALFLWTFWFLGTPDVGVRPWLPGATLAAVGFGVLKVLGAVFVPRLVASSTAIYGSIGIVFAILLWLLLFGRLLVYASVLNAVRMDERDIDPGLAAAPISAGPPGASVGGAVQDAQ